MTLTKKCNFAAVEIESFDGEDTFVRCGSKHGGQTSLICIVKILDDGTSAIVDSGYRSFEEAYEAWPETTPRINKLK